MHKKSKIMIFLICIISILSGCGNKMYTSGQDGYTQISFIDGISFEVVSSVARNATAITNISEDMLFEMNQTYLYKDENTEYFLFNINSIVCIAQKGTTFHFRDAEDKKDALENSGNICGVWFDCPRKKIQYHENEKNGVYKFMTEATAQVAITSELYNDFTGQLTVLDDGTEEWALFIGSIGTEFDDLSKDTQSVITYMAGTLTLYDAPEIVEELPAVTLGGEYETNVPEPKIMETVSSNNASTAEQETEISESKGSLTQISDNDIESSADNTDIYVDSYPEKETVIEKQETSIEELEQEEKEIEVVVESGDESEKSREKENEDDKESEDLIRPASDVVNVIQKSNQKKTVFEDDKVYTVDIYSMLQIGKKGYATTLNGKGNGTAIIQLKEILTGKDAEKLIRKACTNGEVKYQYFSAPEGCNWQVAHYTVDGEGYVNVKLRGMDGENLRFRGIEYSQRTYDIKISDTEIYSFYAVPNGCREYTLEMGEGTVHSGSGALSVYYKIEQ